MSNKDLKQYVLDNRSDAEAVREYMSRPKPNSITIPANLPWEEQQKILKNAIKRASK